MFVLLYALWLILNGRITLEICLLGLLMTAAIYFFMCRFMNFSLKKDQKFMRSAGYGLAYFFVLLKEIFASNFRVMWIVIHKARPIVPAIKEVRIPLKSDLFRAILANSITITPGTITIKVEGDVFSVHCLSEEMIDGIESSLFVRLLKKLED